MTDEVWTLRRAFDLGFCWGRTLMVSPQNMEDSRAVGRTLLCDLFDGLDLDVDVVPSFSSGDTGMCIAKAEIMRALDAQEDRVARLEDENARLRKALEDVGKVQARPAP